MKKVMMMSCLVVLHLCVNGMESGLQLVTYVEGQEIVAELTIGHNSFLEDKPLGISIEEYKKSMAYQKALKRSQVQEKEQNLEDNFCLTALQDHKQREKVIKAAVIAIDTYIESKTGRR